MKKYFVVLFCCFAIHGFASEAVDAFSGGLRAFQANGPDALMNAWYGSDSETKLPEVRARLLALSSRLGPVIETEVFEPKTLGKRVTRLYGVIYFQKRPLWIRADYYTAEGSGGFIALEFSIKPDEILPMEMGIAK